MGKNKNDVYYSVIYDDEYLVVVNKMPGVLSIPDRYDNNIKNLKGLLRKEYDSIYPVHRLDKETSGCIVFAKSPEIHKELNTLFENLKVEKFYHAVVSGVFQQEDELLIDIPLMPNPAGKGSMIPSARGKEAYTKVKVLEKFKSASLLQCELLTGRQHQIRAHLKAIGYPLLVDYLYSARSEFFLSEIKKRYNKPKEEDEKPLINRVSLHSYRMLFDHPILNKKIEVIADYTKDFEILVKQLRKYAKLPEYYIGG